ncbi:protein of unknown function [Filimonas lacunae]|uniref:Uncharacterized protein n=1 Tax=Filimonas lacunae TaxID=477680 RepID=A0A173MPD3_9BACT|nr:DUF4261 domain-containing protein [Filimonas lacunae]BAV09346.1 hypothetical protein FLA_5394 [Filimonas lacunae]SIS71471.1 protein of unknown function [Filimonas lacunae]
MEQENTIVLCIPGTWSSREEVLSSVIDANNGEYLFAGGVLFCPKQDESFMMEAREHDHHMHHAFVTAGMQRFEAEEMEAIKTHKTVVYVSGPGGNNAFANSIMRAGLAILKAGGLGIKVESSGKAFTHAQWEELVNMDHDHRFYEAFVLLVKGANNSIYSCGMHNLGLRDAIADGGEDFMETAELVDIFSVYQVIEKPEIKSGQTFSTAPDMPVYQIQEEPCTFYPEDDLFYNPYGMFHLVLAPEEDDTL